MTVVAELADGRRLEFPDGTDPAVVQSTVKKMIGATASAPTAAGPDRNRLAETGAGALRGVMGIGNTIIDAATYLPSKAIPALEEFRDWRRGGTAQMDQQHKDSNFYAGGKLAAELAGTAGAGGLIAKGARAIPAVAAAAPNLIRAIETSGFVGGGLPTRAAGGAIAGAGSTALADPQSAGAGAAIGGALPVVGKAAGALGSKVAGMLPEKVPANPMKLAAAREAAAAGLVIPPPEIKPQGMVLEALSGWGGKPKLLQVASESNVDKVTTMTRKDLGLAGEGPITPAELDQIKAPHLAVYEDARKLSPDADDAVDAWRQANSDAQKHSLYYEVSKNPKAEKAAKQFRKDARTYAAVIAEEARLAGKPELAEQLAKARVALGQIGSAERAINQVGEVSGIKLGKQLEKGVPLSGGMLSAAKAARVFPKAMQDLRQAPNMFSPVDAGLALGTAATTGDAKYLALILGRPLARALALSGPAQRRAMADPRQRSALLQALMNRTGGAEAYRLAPNRLAPQLGQEGFDQ